MSTNPLISQLIAEKKPLDTLASYMREYSFWQLCTFFFMR